MINNKTTQAAQRKSRSIYDNLETIYERSPRQKLERNSHNKSLCTHENKSTKAKQTYCSDLSENAKEASACLKERTYLSTYHCLNKSKFNKFSHETAVRRDIFKRNKNNVTTEKDINGCLENLEDQWIPNEHNHPDSVEIRNKHNANVNNKPSNRRASFSFIPSRRMFSKEKSELSNDRSTIDVRRRSSQKAEDIISDMKRRLNKSSEQESLNHAGSHKELQINFENNDKNHCDSDDGYIDIFSDDKNFHVDEDGWVTLANENGRRNSIERVFQKIKKCLV